ncbi:MAG: SCP-like extracellular protein [Hyphomicrobiales bacterium]|nr:SCP-like extracellular protein [Hyphomicrobiales bacterium]
MIDAQRPTSPALALRLATAAVLVLGLAACMGETAGGLAPALVARMDAPGANLDRAGALDIVNQYRSTTGSGHLTSDSALETQAQALASQYAASGTAPKKPDGVAAMRVSAGYPTFAETFSGWRNSGADAVVLSTPTATKGGIGVAYNANSGYGVYWVLLIGN